ncbi:MAG: SIS domain-containing protein [Anaerolineae bacterium]
MTGFLDEIAEQPAALLRMLKTAPDSLPEVAALGRGLRAGQFRRVVFTGMGASYYAAHPALIALRQQGLDAHLIETSELLYYQRPVLDTGTLLVCISQSGRSIEIQRLVEALGEDVPILGITNDLASPLAQHSRATVFLNAGAEQTVSTKTYTTTLAALSLVACALGRLSTAEAEEQIASAAEAIAARLSEWRAAVAHILQPLTDVRFYAFLGRGPSLASAMTGALIVKESAKLPTEGMSAAQFRHGPLEVVDSRMAAFIFAGPAQTEALNLNLAATIADLGGHATVIGGEDLIRPAGVGGVALPPDAGHWALPVLEIVPIQFLAAALAARQGFEVGSFRYISKVTDQE